MIDVMFYEAFEEEREEIRAVLPKSIRAAYTSKTIQEAKAKNPPCAVISVRTQSRVPAAWIEKIDGILTRSQGYDHLSAVRQKAGSRVACGYLGSYCSRAVAEHAVLMTMALLRALKKQTRQFLSFKRDGLTGRELRGKRALVVGVGNIGREIVDVAKGLGMPVRGVDIAPKLKGIPYVSLKEGLAWADVIFCALPLTKKTAGMFNYSALQGIRPGTIFINIARGEISPIADLKRLLDKGALGGVGIDVYPEEGALADFLRSGAKRPPVRIKKTLEFARRENVICTPHNAFNTREALKEKAALTADSLAMFLREGRFPHPVPAG
ncbi:MAG TPA: NAD(P)-dependent oxidoreductase [Candidatus Omnitrophota bacterium]|nr:NAD(P)-dependent oxidoreductase [Candidatus Omnitrophota bacterium]